MLHFVAESKECVLPFKWKKDIEKFFDLKSQGVTNKKASSTSKEYTFVQICEAGNVKRHDSTEVLSTMIKDKRKRFPISNPIS